MKVEISAGGVVVRKNKNSWEVLVLRDMNDAWTFPKGLIEDGEDKVETAKREIAEEVGITKVEKIADLPRIHYMYQRNGLISKNVYYYLFQSNGDEPLKPQKEEGIKEAVWMPIDKAMEVIGYAKTNRKMLEKVKELLKKQ